MLWSIIFAFLAGNVWSHTYEAGDLVPAEMVPHFAQLYSAIGVKIAFGDKVNVRRIGDTFVVEKADLNSKTLPFFTVHAHGGVDLFPDGILFKGLPPAPQFKLIEGHAEVIHMDGSRYALKDPTP